MNRIFYALLYAISLLPFSVLYALSRLIYLILNYVIGYRKKTITRNLRNSFPEKSETEIKSIRKKFYKNFADYAVETLKSFSITQEELNKRHTYSNLGVFRECENEQKDVILMAGHIFNWEWFVGLAPNLYTEKTVAVYHKVKNNFWDERINEIRGKFGTIPLEMKKTARYMMSTPNNGEHAYLFVADQSPKKSAIHYDLEFLNQNTPVFIGFDKIAIKKEMAVVFCKMVKVKQGHYHTTFERILPEGENYEPMEIVHKFFKNLEETIRENPDNWLWSHKRWKYEKGTDY